MNISTKNLLGFAAESNKIEGIFGGDRADAHAVALDIFLSLDKPTIEDLKRFVKMLEPSVTYRPESRVNVTIGGKTGMISESIQENLLPLLVNVYEDNIYPNVVHLKYEAIHPFSDCNGRSGRALWLWQMVKFYRYQGDLGFLHAYYYETFRE